MLDLWNKISWKLGLRGPIPAPPIRHGIDGPYADLHDLPRHQPSTVLLEGHEFEVADGFSFYWMHREIYKDQVYQFRPTRTQPFVIDCGASYGVSVIWFKQFCPDARIVAVEADPSIYSILSRNIDRHHFQDVSLLNRAVAGSPGSVAFQCIGADCGRILSGNPGDEAVTVKSQTPLIDVSTIMLDELIGEESVDFLKIDIEGAELEAISSSKRLGQVGQMFIEYHSFVNSPQHLSDLLAILEKEGFRYYISTIYAPKHPYIEITHNQSMDLQLAISATRVDQG